LEFGASPAQAVFVREKIKLHEFNKCPQIIALQQERAPEIAGHSRQCDGQENVSQ
jgi:hypothetical protein